MSNYEDEWRRYKSTRERSRRDDYNDGYDAGDSKSTTLVRRSRDDSVSSVEEVVRDFLPGERGGAYYRETTVRKQGHRPVDRARSFSDDYYYDDSYGDRAAHSRRRRDDTTYVSRRPSKYDDRIGFDLTSIDDRRSRRYDSYSDYSSRSRSWTPPKKERRKSTTEEVLKSIGQGGVARAILRKSKDHSGSRSRDRDRARSRSHRGRSSSSSRSRGGKWDKSRGRAQVTEALKAALLAGVGESVRTRKEPGGWGGDKGKRVLTAAISAGGVDGILSHNREGKGHTTRDVIGSAIAGMATNRIVNGPRSKSRGRTGSSDTGDPQTDSDSDLGSSSGEEKNPKKSRKKGLITAGLASVPTVRATRHASIATIHAARNVYQNMAKRDARRKALKEGDISKKQARREKNRTGFQDAAGIGIAALGIKGAYNEWQEMREHTKETKEAEEKVERHKEKREARRMKATMWRPNDTGKAGSRRGLAAL